jgi:hypothetical protein
MPSLGCDDGSDDGDEDDDEDPTLGGFVVPDGAELPVPSEEGGNNSSGEEQEVSTRSGRVSRRNKRGYGEMDGQRYL